jgi:DNA-directed RNA polymerase specialized sigma24 family protein
VQTKEVAINGGIEVLDAMTVGVAPPPEATVEQRRAFVTAITALVAARRPWFLRRIRSRMGPALVRILEPEDLLHDALVDGIVAANCGRVPSDAGLQAWMMAVAENRIAAVARKNQSRKRPRRGTPLPCALIAYGVPDEALGANQVDEALPAMVRAEELRTSAARLNELPSRQRLSVVLRDLLQLPWDAVAFATGGSPAAAMKLHQRARRTLAERPEPRGSQPSHAPRGDRPW